MEGVPPGIDSTGEGDPSFRKAILLGGIPVGAANGAVVVFAGRI